MARLRNHDIVSSHGYKKEMVGEHHPLADPHGYAYTHILVLYSALNDAQRKLINPDDVCHHENGDTKDNRLENLGFMPLAEHSWLHAKNIKRGKDGRFVKGKK